MKTTRNIISSWFLYLGALLGSTFGMLESFGLLMSLFETGFDKIEQKRRKKVYSEMVFETSYRLKEFIWSEFQIKELVTNGFVREETDYQKILRIRGEAIATY